jgi:branched-chain amino acid transport system ATP-binding protein
MSGLLVLEDVDASYGATTVLRGVSLEVADGGMVALLGANGAGKTTTLRAICNMGVKTRGGIRFAGKCIGRTSTEDIVRLGIGHVPEGRGTFMSLSVDENLRLGALRRRDAGIAGDIARICDYFPVLRDRMDQQAGTLSGGEQQMLAIARALMSRPRLLLLDEPSFGLAPVLVQDIFRILRVINKEERMSILLVEQNARLAFDLVGQVFLLETGRVVASGPPQQIAADETVRRAYLGQ